MGIMREDKEELLTEIFTVVFDLSEDQNPREVRRTALAKWDSLGHVSLVSAIESEMGVSISAADSEFLTSFEAARVLLEGKGL